VKTTRRSALVQSLPTGCGFDIPTQFLPSAQGVLIVMSLSRLQAVMKVGVAALLGAWVVALAHVGWSGQEAGSRSHRFRLKPAERCFMHRINARRARAGRKPLRWDRHLVYVARRHARSLAKGGRVRHDPDLGRKVTRWRSLGENTGRGRTCRGLLRALWRSPHHRANMLGRWRFMGVGTARRHGRIYVQQVFEARSDPGNVWSYP